MHDSSLVHLNLHILSFAKLKMTILPFAFSFSFPKHSPSEVRVDPLDLWLPHLLWHLLVLTLSFWVLIRLILHYLLGICFGIAMYTGSGSAKSSQSPLLEHPVNDYVFYHVIESSGTNITKKSWYFRLCPSTTYNLLRKPLDQRVYIHFSVNASQSV